MSNPKSWKDRIEQMIDNMLLCVLCNENSIIQVAESSGIPFYSCITEGCEREAQLLVYIGGGELVKYDKVYNTLEKIVKYGIPDKVDSNEGES